MRNYLYIPLLVLLLVGCQEKPEALNTSSETKVNTFSFYKDTANLGLTEAIYTIEHLSDTGRIYSKDSLRFGTRLDSVVPNITYKAIPAAVKYILPDTVVVSTGLDTLDFSKAPIYLYVQSSDLTQERWYRIDIAVHTVDPELYVWKQLSAPFPPQHCDMKAFYIDGEIELFVNNGFSTQLYSSKAGIVWESQGAPIGLPTFCSVRDILQCNDTLYYTEGNKIYKSTDPSNWDVMNVSIGGFSVVNMLVAYHDMPWCILQDSATSGLCLGRLHNGTIEPMTNVSGLSEGFLPKDFPVSDFAALSFASSSERPRAMIVGGRTQEGIPVNTRWNIEYERTAGYRMLDFSIEQPSFASLTGMSIIQYDQHLMMFGGIDNDMDYRSDILYSDDEGMHWYAPDSMQNRLPDNYTSRQRQTVVVDDQNNIYIIGGQDNTQSYSDVYRGYKNELKW
jgi:hypothetical protein